MADLLASRPPAAEPGFSPAPAADPEAEARRRILELQRGVDPEANFRHLFEAYHRPLSSFFLQHGVPRDEALDLVQETFFRVYKNIGGFRFGSSFKTWLLEIALNLWRNSLRHRSAEKRKAEEVPLEQAVLNEGGLPAGPAGGEAESRTVLDGLLLAEQARLLHGAVQELPPQMRRCVQLYLYGDLSYPEIAALLQVEAATVKSQMHQARQRLRQTLGEYFEHLDFDRKGPP
jgi:RNA polymerase sigma-70 factor, ECF subfamily